jgi:glyoxylase-like metal-dependent hydrolase (beta-lactamase superfamily II)
MADITRVTKMGFVNCYLVREDDGLTLVDTMLPKSGKQIVGEAEKLGAPIVRIVLTHAHGDHIGSLDELHGLLPDAEVIITARDARFLAKDMSLDPGEPADKLRGGYTGAETKPTRTVEAGERIGSLEVLATPGHTPGHASFLDTRDNTLITGDAYSTFGGVATPSKFFLPFPLVWAATWSRETALESAKALRKLDPARLAPGHGKIIESPDGAMDKAIARGV